MMFNPFQESLEAALSSGHLEFMYDHAYIDAKGRPAVWKYRVTFDESGGYQCNVHTRKVRSLFREVFKEAEEKVW